MFNNRLSQKEDLILTFLVRHGKLYGLEFVKMSEGLLKRGTIYVTLSRMEEQDLVESWVETSEKGGQGPPRRVYKISGKGLQIYQAWQVWKESVQVAPNA